MGIASLVLGIISIVIGVFSAGSLGWLGAVIGIVIGIQGKKIPDQAGMAQGGFICSIIGTVLCLLTYIACVACVGCLALLA